MHTGRWGAGRWGIRKGPPFQIFKKLVNKNAMTPKVWDPPGKLVQKAFDLPRDFGKNLSYPLPWIINSVQVLIYAQVLRALLLA